MKHERTRALFDYWDDLRRGRLAPYRSEVEPRAIAPLLDSTFILEHVDGGMPRFRLAGTRLCERFGMELRGMSALAFWHGECRRRMRALLQQVVTTPCIGHVSCSVENRDGRLAEVEFLYMPLRSDLGEMSRIMGCAYYVSEPAAALRAESFEPLHHWIDRLETHAIDAPNEAEATAGFYESQAQPHGGERRRRRDGVKRPAKSPEALNATLRALRDELRDKVGAPGRPADGALERPRLTSIEGGLASAPRPEAAARETSRGHLRLVKSDAG
ncbi:MAG: PAS domain-containing protein [Pseudomonadota bacterium]